MGGSVGKALVVGAEKTYGLDNNGNVMWDGSNWSAGMGDNIILAEGHAEGSYTDVYTILSLQELTDKAIEKAKRDIEERRNNPKKKKGGKW